MCEIVVVFSFSSSLACLLAGSRGRTLSLSYTHTLSHMHLFTHTSTPHPLGYTHIHTQPTHMHQTPACTNPPHPLTCFQASVPGPGTPFILSFFLGFRRPNLITGLSGWRAPDWPLRTQEPVPDRRTGALTSLWQTLPPTIQCFPRTQHPPSLLS